MQADITVVVATRITVVSSKAEVNKVVASKVVANRVVANKAMAKVDKTSLTIHFRLSQALQKRMFHFSQLVLASRSHDNTDRHSNLQ